MQRSNRFRIYLGLVLFAAVLLVIGLPNPARFQLSMVADLNTIAAYPNISGLGDMKCDGQRFLKFSTPDDKIGLIVTDGTIKGTHQIKIPSELDTLEGFYACSISGSRAVLVSSRGTILSVDLESKATRIVGVIQPNSEATSGDGVVVINPVTANAATTGDNLWRATASGKIEPLLLPDTDTSAKGASICATTDSTTVVRREGKLFQLVDRVNGQFELLLNDPRISSSATKCTSNRRHIVATTSTNAFRIDISNRNITDLGLSGSIFSVLTGAGEFTVIQVSPPQGDHVFFDASVGLGAPIGTLPAAPKPSFEVALPEGYIFSSGIDAATRDFVMVRRDQVRSLGRIRIPNFPTEPSKMPIFAGPWSSLIALDGFAARVVFAQSVDRLFYMGFLKTDGTRSGTTISEVPLQGFSKPWGIGTSLLYMESDGGGGRDYFFLRSDGSVEPFPLIASPGSKGSLVSIVGRAGAGIVTLSNSSATTEFWVTDPSRAIIKRIPEGVENVRSDVRGATDSKGRLFFRLFTANSSQFAVLDDVKSPLKTLATVEQANGQLLPPVVMGSTAYIGKATKNSAGSSDFELLQSNGTIETTRKVDFIPAGYQFGRVDQMNGRLLLGLTKPESLNRFEFWISDGSRSGTQQLLDPTTGAPITTSSFNFRVTDRSSYLLGTHSGDYCISDGDRRVTKITSPFLASQAPSLFQVSSSDEGVFVQMGLQSPQATNVFLLKASCSDPREINTSGYSLELDRNSNGIFVGFDFATKVRNVLRYDQSRNALVEVARPPQIASQLVSKVVGQVQGSTILYSVDNDGIGFFWVTDGFESRTISEKLPISFTTVGVEANGALYFGLTNARNNAELWVVGPKRRFVVQGPIGAAPGVDLPRGFAAGPKIPKPRAPKLSFKNGVLKITFTRKRDFQYGLTISVTNGRKRTKKSMVLKRTTHSIKLSGSSASVGYRYLDVGQKLSGPASALRQISLQRKKGN